jgi:phage baseplate assembly protein W
VENEFYGRGIGYPLQLGVTGGLRESAQVRKVEESIRVILGTQYGERVMRPRFGCNLKSLVFAPNNEATANVARYYVEEGLREWEPRIEVIEVLVTNDNRNGALIIHINYRLRATQDVQSMVFPFYLEQA